MMTKSEAWFEKNIHENQEELVQIGELAMRSISDKFALTLNKPELVLVIYDVTFKAIIDVLKEKEEVYPDYAINIADRVEIGYSNYNNENAEKNGNFMVSIKHLAGKKINNRDDESDDTIELATQWNAYNITSDIETIQDIAERAKKALDDSFDVSLGSAELIMPLFISIHEALVSYLSIKRVENQTCEYEINMCGEFAAGVREDEEANEVVYFIPPVDLRLYMKDDFKANKNAN